MNEKKKAALVKYGAPLVRAGSVENARSLCYELRIMNEKRKAKAGLLRQIFFVDVFLHEWEMKSFRAISSSQFVIHNSPLGIAHNN